VVGVLSGVVDVDLDFAVLGSPAASRTVAAMSITWLNWWRISP
jgi:hypothetical protein